VAFVFLMEWSIFHNYRRLAQDGKAKPLTCPDCDNQLFTQADENNDPILWCIACDTKILPGLDMYDQIKAVVREHYV